jgi:hypothetical protein
VKSLAEVVSKPTVYDVVIVGGGPERVGLRVLVGRGRLVGLS